MAEIEADVAAGKTINLMDVVNAQKAERKPENPGRKPSLLGQLAKNKATVAQKNKDTAQKETPIRKNGHLGVDD